MAIVPSVQITGDKELRRDLRRAKDDELKKALKEANREGAEIVASEARYLVPVRTGRLRDSIRAAGAISSGVVRAGKARVPYAGPIHFGWGRRNIHPQPFLYEAADRRVGEVLNAYAANVEKIRQTLDSGGGDTI